MIILLGGHPYSEYRESWDSLIHAIYPEVEIITVALEIKPEFSSVALSGRSEAVKWEKLIARFDDFQCESEKRDYVVESESGYAGADDALSYLLVCSDPRIMSAPQQVLERADLIIITYASEQDTCRTMIMQKKDTKHYREIDWSTSVERFRGFQGRFETFETATKAKIVFVNEKASMKHFEIHGGAKSEMRTGMHRYAIGVHGDMKEAFAQCQEPHARMSKQVASDRLVSLRSEMKKAFAEKAKRDISALLRRYPESHQECLDYALDQINRESIKAIIMSVEQHKSVCQAIIDIKMEFKAAGSTTELSLANVLTRHSLKYWKGIEENLYRLDDSKSLMIFVGFWNDYRKSAVKPSNTPFLAPELQLSLRHISAVRQLCTELFLAHNFFCIDNPSIFDLVIHLVASKNPMFVDSGIGLLSDILKMRSAQRFAKVFLDEDHRLSANVAAAALEGLGHLLKPISDFMALTDQQKSTSGACEVASYLINLTELLSEDIWKAFDFLFRGLPKHASLIQPVQIRNLLEPLVFARRHLMADTKTVHKFSVNVVAIMQHILTYGTISAVEAIMCHAGDVAEVASAQIINEIQLRMDEKVAKVRSVSRAVERVLLSVLNLLDRIVVPRSEISPHVQIAESNVIGTSATVDFLAHLPAHYEPTNLLNDQDFRRIQELYSADLARLLQLEVEKVRQDEAYRKLEAMYKEREYLIEETTSKLRNTENLRQEKEKELNNKICMLEKLLEDQMQESIANLRAKENLLEVQKTEISKLKQSGASENRAFSGDVPKKQDPNPEAESVPLLDDHSSSERAIKMDAVGFQDSPEAKQDFIRLIHDERMSIPMSLRPSFCGMLKHLGEDLYTSKAHFLQELLQNADDNTFHEQESPAMHVFLADRFVTIGNNEVGMKAGDVLSLCSAASSNKKSGLHTGQKGLGFKSVYACCKSPTILSNGWRFQFKTEGSTDEMAYIDPHWVEEDPEELEAVKKALGSSAPQVRTLVHLPLKELRDPNILKDLSPISLLCARNLRNLHIYQMGSNKCFNQPSSVLCHTFELEQVSWTLDLPTGYTLATDKTQKWRARLTCREAPGEKCFSDLPWDEHGNLDFLAFEAQIQYPRPGNEAVCGERRKKSELPTAIRVLFPLTDKSKDWPVCATLPVCQVGLPFILQADWDVVTSRENIRISIWNENLIDCLVAMISAVFQNCSELHGLLSKYLVKVDLDLPIWKGFEQKLTAKVGSQLPKNCFLPDVAIDTLKIPDDLLLQCGYKVVRRDSAEVSLKVLMHCGRYLKAKHILDSFQAGQAVDFSDWVQSQGPEWWARLFQLVVDSFYECGSDGKQEILNLVKKQPLYLINVRRVHSSELLSLKRSVVAFSDFRTKVFYCEGLSQQRFYSWRKEITVLRPTSSSELAFLKNVLSIQPVCKDVILDAMIDLHNESCFDIEYKWGDFIFLAGMVSDSKLSVNLIELGKRLCAPTVTSGHMPVCACTLVSLMGRRVADSGRLMSLNDSESGLVCVEVVDQELNLCDTVCIEQLLITLGCKLPPKGTEPCTFQDLPELSKMTKEDADACLKLLQSAPVHLRNYLSCCRLALHDASNSEAAQLTFASSISLETDLLPRVIVPEFALELAEALGVGIRTNFSIAVRAMLALVQRGCLDVTEYAIWLAHFRQAESDVAEAMKLSDEMAFAEPTTLESSVDSAYSARCWIEHIHKYPFIAAEVETGPKRLELRHLTVEGIYCPDEAAFADFRFVEDASQELPHISFIVARLLRKAVVCRQRNGALSHLAGILRKIGCKAEPNLADTTLALHALRANPESYVHGGKGNMLKPAATNEVLALYRRIEHILSNIDGAARRKAMLSDAISSCAEMESIAMTVRYLRGSDDQDCLPSSSDDILEADAHTRPKLGKNLNFNRPDGDLCAALPLLLSDYSFQCGLHPGEVFLNPYTFIAEALCDSSVQLLHAVFSYECPILCEAIGVGNLADRTICYICTSLSENIPQHMKSESASFELALSCTVHVLKVRYIDMYLYLMDGCALRVYDGRHLAARHDRKDQETIIDTPSDPQAVSNPHLRVFRVFADIPYVIAGNVVIIPGKSDAQWRLVAEHVLAQMLVRRKGYGRAEAESKAERALREFAGSGHSTAWDGFEDTLHTSLSSVEFPAGLAGNGNSADENMEAILAMDRQIVSADTPDSGGVRMNVEYGTRDTNFIRHELMGNTSGFRPRIRHIDQIFQARLTLDDGVEGGGGRFTALDPKKYEQGRSVMMPTAVDSTAAENVGLAGERLVCLKLQQAYPDTFDPKVDWKSSARLKFFPAAPGTTAAMVDDTLGYDMQVNDTKDLFVDQSQTNESSTMRKATLAPGVHKLCFIEVKTTAKKFCGVFHLSRNEIRVRKECAALGNARSCPQSIINPYRSILVFVSLTLSSRL